MRVASLILAVVLCALAPTTATADERTDQVLELVSQAQEAYAADDYGRAIALLNQAYALYPDPAIRFNMARAYEAHGDCEKARWAFRDVIDNEEADAEVRQTAKAGLKAMTCQEVAPVVVVGPEPDNDSGVSPWVSWSAVGLGVVCLAAGGVLQSGSYDTHDELARIGADGRSRAQYDDARTRLDDEIFASKLMYGAGAVLVGAGAVGLLFFEESASVALIPTPVGVSLSARATW